MRRCVTVFKSSLEDLKQLTFFFLLFPKTHPRKMASPKMAKPLYSLRSGVALFTPTENRNDCEVILRSFPLYLVISNTSQLVAECLGVCTL